MTEVSSSRSLVRPRFLKWSIVAFVVLLPFACHALWDYIEMRRLREAFQRIAEVHEPLTARENVRAALASTAAKQAGRYYRAAAALASDYASDQDLMRRFRVSRRDQRWLPSLVQDLEAYVERYHEAFTLVDRAIEVESAAFPAGTRYNYFDADLWKLSGLCGLRAASRALEGRGSEAVDSLLCQVRVSGLRDTEIWDLGWYTSLADVQLVFERAPASQRALQRLAEALIQAEGSDDRLRRRYLHLRAMIIDASGLSPHANRSRIWDGSIGRPLTAHRLTNQLQAFDALLDSADGSWPGQMDRVQHAVSANSALAGPPFIPVPLGEIAERAAVSWATALAGIRIMRVAVAVELYRRDHDEGLPTALDALMPSYLPDAPIDPFSGSPIVLKSTNSGYAVYSLGANRKDDGGDVIPPTGAKQDAFPETPDLGVTVRPVGRDARH